MTSNPNINPGIDTFFKRKKPWSHVKDEIVAKYIACYLKTVPNLGKPILIVDAFAGPGRFEDGHDGSPLLICKSIASSNAKSASARCLFADANAQHRLVLRQNISRFIESGTTAEPFSDCQSALRRAIDSGTNSTIFFYLDPYGIKDLEFETVRQIYERAPSRSTEVLINFSFRTFMRMSGNWSYGDSAQDIASKVKKGKTETINKVMGGDYWEEIVSNPTLDKIDREDAVVSAYMERIRQYFNFVYAIPVKERTEDDLGIPDDQLARYHLIFATRSTRAVTYMNDVALNALDPYLRQFRDGLLFDFTPDRYKRADESRIKDDIVQLVSEQPSERPHIYERIMPNYFMQYRKKDYRKFIDQLVFDEKRLKADTSKMRKSRALNDDVTLFVSHSS